MPRNLLIVDDEPSIISALTRSSVRLARSCEVLRGLGVIAGLAWQVLAGLGVRS